MGGSMKIILPFFLATIALFTQFVYANGLGAVDDLTSFLKIEMHSGLNSEGQCLVLVEPGNTSGKRSIKVTVSDNRSTNSKIIIDGSDYRIFSDRHEFIQSDRIFTNHDRTNYNENILRTIDADSKKLYVVVANETVRNTETTYLSATECVIDL
jgi:hypothetical protein